jgi:hypothetical protein
MTSLLTLINSKGKVIFEACYSEEQHVYANYNRGAGYYKEPKDFFLSAAGCLADCPACKISGEYADEFKEYYKDLPWIISKIK